MVRSFLDLTVYQNLYEAMIVELTKVIPKLPREEKFDLAAQMRRACKAPPALMAEGYAQKHHRKEWQKYLKDAIEECNEMIVHLSCTKDVYLNYVDKNLCEELIKIYNNKWQVVILSRQKLETCFMNSQHKTHNQTNNTQPIPTTKQDLKIP